MATRLPTAVHIHGPKTGGTWIRRASMAALGRTAVKHLVGGHAPYSSINAAHLEGRLAFGTARNPWDWYPSYWEHSLNADDAQWAAIQHWGGGTIDFRAVLYGMTHPTNERVPKHHVLFGMHDRGGLLESGLSLYSWMLRELYTGVAALVDTLQMPEAMAEITGTPVAKWRATGPANTRRERGQGRFRGPPSWRDLYDDEMIGWVAEADAEIIDTMGFEPFSPARRPVVYL